MNAHDTLTQINADINQARYVEDLGPDNWTPLVPGRGGDCDSYATAKAQRLYECGWPMDQVQLATCWTETSEYHCVLLVTMQGQTWVLDNRHALPVEFQLLDYKWHRLQVPSTQCWEYAQQFMDDLKEKSI